MDASRRLRTVLATLGPARKQRIHYLRPFACGWGKRLTTLLAGEPLEDLSDDELQAVSAHALCLLLDRPVDPAGSLLDVEVVAHVANVAPGRTLPRPVLCLIDEAGTVGAIVNLPQWLATLRSAPVGCVLAFQALSQATTIYGPEGRADIEENSQTHLLFGGAGFASAAWMSAGIGDTTVVQHSAGKGRERTRVFAGTGNESMSEASAPLLRPEQITELRPGTLLVRIAHHRPVRTMVAPWYRSWRLKRRAGRLLSSKQSEGAAVIADDGAARQRPVA